MKQLTELSGITHCRCRPRARFARSGLLRRKSRYADPLATSSRSSGGQISWTDFPAHMNVTVAVDDDNDALLPGRLIARLDDIARLEFGRLCHCVSLASLRSLKRRMTGLKSDLGA